LGMGYGIGAGAGGLDGHGTTGGHPLDYNIYDQFSYGGMSSDTLASLADRYTWCRCYLQPRLFALTAAAADLARSCTFLLSWTLALSPLHRLFHPFHPRFWNSLLLCYPRPPLFISYLYELSRSLTCYTCVCPSVCITCMIRDDFVLITTVTTTLPHHQPCLPVIFLRRYHYSFIFFFIFLRFSGVIGPGIWIELRLRSDFNWSRPGLCKYCRLILHPNWCCKIAKIEASF